MNIQELIAKIRAWQAANAEYETAADEVLQINDGKSYPSSARRRAAIKALDAAAMAVIHYEHSDEALEAFVALAAAGATLEQLLSAIEPLREGITFREVWHTTADVAGAQALIDRLDNAIAQARKALSGADEPSG